MSRWPYNTKRWKVIREQVLVDQPFCVYCEEVCQTTPATEVDHIVPVRLEPKRAFDRDNLQGLCKYCHDSVKAREEHTGRRIGAGVDGLPLGGW